MTESQEIIIEQPPQPPPISFIIWSNSILNLYVHLKHVKENYELIRDDRKKRNFLRENKEKIGRVFKL